MKKIVSILAFVLAASFTMRAGEIVTDSLYSSVLKAQVKFNVYLPQGFGKTPGKLYPVAYLLHGLSDDYTAWKDKGNMKLVADELIETGEAKEMVIVMPNAGGADIRNVQNGYFNMPGWSYEDFFFGEFIPAVEKKYKVKSDKAHRAVMGLSMGGGGSVVYCQHHPDMFSSCFAMSGWLDEKARLVGGDLTQIDCFYHVCKAVRDNSALDFVDNADEKTLDALRSIKWFIDCGDDDFIFDLSIAFYQKMRNRGVKSELRVRNGVHNWEYWHNSLRLALPFISRNFEK